MATTMAPPINTFGASEPNAATHATKSQRLRKGLAPPVRRGGRDARAGSSMLSSRVFGERGVSGS